MKQSQRNNAGLSRRLRFTEDERRLPWLPMLLDAYAIVDTGVAIAVRNEQRKRKKTLACAKGCGNCCGHQQDLPLYPHELVGIYWYASEKLVLPGRDALKNRLAGHTHGSGCPFLINDSCSIHPVRPVGCRQFNVFSSPCLPGEDPYYSRRDDVLDPLVEYTDRAFEAVLPFYSINKQADTSTGIRIIRSQIMNIHSFDWTKLVLIMDQFPSSDR